MSSDEEHHPDTSKGLQTMPLDRKVSGTRPLYNLSEEEQKAHIISEDRLEEEATGPTKEERIVDLSDSEYKGSTDDSGDFIFTLGPLLSNETEPGSAQSGPKNIPKTLDKSKQGKSDDYKGEFVINLAELKEEMDVSKTSELEVIDIEEVEEEGTSAQGVIELGGTDDEYEKESFVITLGDSVPSPPSEVENSTTMSGEFMIASSKLAEEKSRPQRKTETIEIDISMLNEEDAEE